MRLVAAEIQAIRRVVVTPAIYASLYQGVWSCQVLCEAAHCWEQSQAPVGKAAVVPPEVTRLLKVCTCCFHTYTSVYKYPKLYRNQVLCIEQGRDGGEYI